MIKDFIGYKAIYNSNKELSREAYMEFELNDNKIFIDSIRDIDVCMLTTLASDGVLHSRPMLKLEVPQKSFEDRMLWFFSKKDSTLNHDIEKDQNVNLNFINSDKKQYISVVGKASLFHDKSLMYSYWSKKLESWFPDGLDDPNISLIGIKVESADIWNSPPGKVLKMIRLIFSSIGGRFYDTSPSNVHLELRE